MFPTLVAKEAVCWAGENEAEEVEHCNRVRSAIMASLAITYIWYRLTHCSLAPPLNEVNLHAVLFETLPPTGRY